MSGSDKYLVDTNVLAFLLEGNAKAASTLEGKTLFISFITEIELLGVSGITPEQEAVVNEALEKLTKLGFTESIGRKTIAIKQRKKVKVPDAIIAATSIEHNIPLLTADKAFSNIDALSCILFEV